jgi:hypothetical protein
MVRSLGLMAALVAAMPAANLASAQNKAVIPSAMMATGQVAGDPWRASGASGRGRKNGGPSHVKRNAGRSQMAKKRQRRHRRSWR